MRKAKKVHNLEVTELAVLENKIFKELVKVHCVSTYNDINVIIQEKFNIVRQDTASDYYLLDDLKAIELLSNYIFINTCTFSEAYFSLKDQIESVETNAPKFAALSRELMSLKRKVIYK